MMAASTICKVESIFNVLPLGGHQDHLGFEALSPSGQSRVQMNHRQELYEVVTKILK